MTEQETVTHCWSCGHPVESHDPNPDGRRPCRTPGHPKGVPCVDCRAMLTPQYRDRLAVERDADWFQAVWGAYTVTLADAQDAFGTSAPAYFTDIHQSALASALIAYREKQATDDVAARVEQACHDLPYEYTHRILAALEDKEPTK